MGNTLVRMYLQKTIQLCSKPIVKHFIASWRSVGMSFYFEGTTPSFYLCDWVVAGIRNVHVK